MNTAKVIGFAGQKGGIGKSSLSIILANHIHFETDLSVVVFDVDFQKTLHNRREEDLQLYASQNGKKAAEDLKEDLYEIIPINPVTLATDFDSLKDQVDVILIDIPGNVTQMGNLQILSKIDFLIVPLQVTSFTVSSVNEFREGMDNAKEKYAWEMDIYIVVNMLNSTTTNGRKIEEIKEMYNENEWKTFETNIPLLTSKIGERITSLESMSSWHHSIEEFCKEVLEKAFKAERSAII